MKGMQFLVLMKGKQELVLHEGNQVSSSWFL